MRTLPEKERVSRRMSRTGRSASWWFIACLFAVHLSFAFFAPRVYAQAVSDLHLEPPPDLSEFENQPLSGVLVETMGDLWDKPASVRSVKKGDVISGELVRRALRELDRTGNYADLRAELKRDGAELYLVIRVRPRKLVAQVRFKGGLLQNTDESRALGLTSGDAVTDLELERSRLRLVKLYKDSGYPHAGVAVFPEDTDEAREVLVRVEIQPGEPQPISKVRFSVAPSPHHPALSKLLSTYRLEEGDRLDAKQILDENEELTERLIEDGFYEAEVTHTVSAPGLLTVQVATGPRFGIRIEGNEAFGFEDLVEEMKLTGGDEPRVDVIAQLLRTFYVNQGFLDAHVEVKRFDDQSGLRSEIYAWIREGQPFRITQRLYPCLTGDMSARDLDEEVEGVLSEKLPSPGFLSAPSLRAVDRATMNASSGSRSTPFAGQPWLSFSDEGYGAAVEHLRDLYRSEGYLDAEVGPVTVVRRQCLPGSPPGDCRVEGELPLPVTSCSSPALGDTITHTCVPDRATGTRCEAEGTLVIPVHAGNQAILYDIRVEGNREFSERQILSLTKLSLGKPLRRRELDAALRRIQDRYEEEAYAFVQIDSEIELSPDHTRARLVLSITERQQVRVRRIDVRGASETREGLIRRRLSLKVGELYRRSLVQKSQEQLESLGVFTSTTIGLEDAGIPAREKVVVVTVSERLPQYLDIKGGFASIDGFRVGFEYGHRNLGGEAIQLTLRSQLALRPPFLIAEKDVRIKYQELTDIERLERRNTITLAFPETGLGPLFRFEIELLDLLDNARDFSQTRDAAVVRLLFRPRRIYLFQLGGTVELNNAKILGGDSLLDFVQENPGQNILIPEGRSIAYTQNFNASWDGRDKPLSATRGMYVGGGVEHVRADPLGESRGECNEDSTEVFDQVCSQLLRFSGRVSGYIPLSKKGMTLALSLRAGVIQHLTESSRTYPDRLFFMGGADTLRGYPQFSLVPQDLADRVLDPNDELTIEAVVLRGGDIFINPRAEWRIPISRSVQTALFLDTGNLWADRSLFNPLELRYTAGSGLRIQTPVGPLVFDYGFNLERLIDKLGGGGENQRVWEDIGAFHFSIGLF